MRIAFRVAKFINSEYARQHFSILFFCILLILTSRDTFSQQKPAQQYYELRIYQYSSSGQDSALQDFLAKAYVPALHRAKIASVGIFESIGNDTAKTKSLYILVPFSSLVHALSVTEILQNDKEFLKAGIGYLDAPFDKAPYDRFETILLKAFSLAPVLQTPKLNSARIERIYELRSYESATEKTFRNKVEMFNEGGEIALFHRLGFNAVFYAEAISGSRMPNLMYMTSFDNKSSRDAHWKTFVEDTEWKKMSSLPQYQHNVSKADIILLRPTSYSDY